MKYRHLLFSVLTLSAFSVLLQQTEAATPPLPATNSGSTAVENKPKKLFNFAFANSDLDLVMAQYCEWTNQVYLKTDEVNASITIKANDLTKKECIEVIEAILAMNNIALVPFGEKYIKVVRSTSSDLTGHGLKINMNQEQQYAGTDRFVTQIIQLKHVEIPEVQAAVQHLLHAYGKILVLRNSNSLIVTDTEANIIQVRELIDFIDQPTARIEPRVYQIKYADATGISEKLNEIITMAQADQNKTTPTSTRNFNRRTYATIRSLQAAAKTTATISNTEGRTTVIIQGTVKVMADNRTNIILIFSQEENFGFFDKIIEVLDVEVEPPISFEVVKLEYADAEDLSSTLNELVGIAKSTRGESRQQRKDSKTERTIGKDETRKGIRQETSGLETDALQNLNNLSDNIKILSDKRSNAILLMGKKSDIAALKNVIASLDLMLEQVMIEAAIFEVTLGDELRHGIDWLYRNKSDGKLGAWNGGSLLTSSNSVASVANGALTYYQNLTGINTEVAINLAATDSNVRLLSTPVIITTDNTEAHLSVGEQRPIVTSTSSYANSSGTKSSTYEYKNIGINLTVTPHINPQRVVIMEVLQQANQVGGEVGVGGDQVPIILNREFEAQVSVRDRGTIALGGLITSETRDFVTKIPILGDIPFIGRYLFSNTLKKNVQTELIVLLTPYVMENLDEAENETDRLYDSIDMEETDWPENNWSGSSLRSRDKPNQKKEGSKKQSTTHTVTPEPSVLAVSPNDDDRSEIKKLLNLIRK